MKNNEPPTSRESEGEVKPYGWFLRNPRGASFYTADEGVMTAHVGMADPPLGRWRATPLYAAPQPAQPSVEACEQVSEGSLLRALQETPGNNWLAQNMPDGSIQRIDELYRAFARRVMGRARQFDAENRAREISKGA